MEVNKILHESSKIKNHYSKGYNTMVKYAELKDADTEMTWVVKNNSSIVNFFKKLTRWWRPEIEFMPTRLSFLMDGGWHR